MKTYNINTYIKIAKIWFSKQVHINIFKIIKYALHIIKCTTTNLRGGREGGGISWKAINSIFTTHIFWYSVAQI